MPNSAMRASNEKKWAPKVRTGCITCKRRRVKCDEKKPACDRCTTAGLTCEGYAKVPRSHLFYSTSELRRLRVTRNGCLIGSIGSLGSPELATERERAQPSQVFSLPSNIFASHLEYSAYMHWLSATRSLFQTSRDALSFWSETVPQAASTSRVVLDALVAVSLKAKCLSDAASDEEQAQNSVMALEHGIKAIRNIRAGTEPHTENVLLAAVLLWLMELIGGRLDIADLHLKSAFRIVEQETSDSSSTLYNIVRETWRLWSICYKPVPIDPELIETEKNPVAKEGLYFLALAKDCFKNTIEELREKTSSTRDHDITILESSLGLTLWILTKWMMLFGSMWHNHLETDEVAESSSSTTSPTYSESVSLSISNKSNGSPETQSETLDTKILSSAILKSLQKSARDAAHTTVSHQELAVRGVLNVFFSLISGSDIALKQELQAVLESSSHAISTHIRAIQQQPLEEDASLGGQYIQSSSLGDFEAIRGMGTLLDP